MFENDNFLFLIDYNTRYNYSCESSGCHEEGICRCSRIEDVTINNVDLRRLSIDIFKRFEDDDISTKRNKKVSEILWDYDYSEINIYCIERILTINKVWNEDSWFPRVSGGYYGEEIEDILLQPVIFEKISNEIQSIINLETLEEKVFYLLQLEYGKVLDNLASKKMSVQIIDYDKLEFSQKSHLEKVASKELKHYENYKGIKGLVKRYGEKYRVIDGYHRLFAHKLKKVSVIVVE